MVAMELDRELAFKGGRTYLHSTTLFDDIVALRGDDLRGIDFRFNHKTARQVRYQSAPPAGDQVGVGIWRDHLGEFHIVERDAPVTRRQPYDEDALADLFAFAGRHVEVPADVGGHSAVEAIVAGFKALLQRTVAGRDARLAFVRLRLASLPRLPLAIRFGRRIGEFYQGDILLAGEPAGQIFFGEWR
jgi:hypothetical protein